MNILYIHGFGSKFNPNNNKIKSLIKHLPKYLVDFDLPVNVFGVDIDYTTQNPISVCFHYLKKNPDIDMIIGTSMGGWTASHVGLVAGIPWVALNPAIKPKDSLKEHVGRFTDFYGVCRELTTDHINLVYDREFHVCDDGLVIVEKGDERFDYREIIDYLDMEMDFSIYEGGSHRFENMKDACEDIADHWNTVSTRG